MCVCAYLVSVLDCCVRATSYMAAPSTLKCDHYRAQSTEVKIFFNIIAARADETISFCGTHKIMCSFEFA